MEQLRNDKWYGARKNDAPPFSRLDGSFLVVVWEKQYFYVLLIVTKVGVFKASHENTNPDEDIKICGQRTENKENNKQ